MTKKFLSLLLSIVMVVGLLPVMNVWAKTTEATPLMTENFEDFTANTWFNENFDGTGASLKSNSNVTNLSVGDNVRAKIVEVTGYDGKPTNAVELFTNSAAVDPDAPSDGYAWAGDEGYARLNYTSYTVPTSGKVVTEFKVNLPEDENGVVRSIRRFNARPIVIREASNSNEYQIGIGNGFATSQFRPLFTADKGAWYKITVVYDYADKLATLYVNDELVSGGYKVDLSGKYVGKLGLIGRASITNRSNAPGTDASGKESILLDDFNFYVPGTTTASSDFDGYDDVKVNDNITVDFDNMILDTVIGSDATVTKDCVVMSDAAGNAVEIESVNVSADSKSLIIKPKYDFTAGTQYNVAVSGLTDMYSQPIDSYSFTFHTTAPNPIELTSAPAFKLENLFQQGSTATQITQLQEGYVTASFAVTNTHATAAKDVVMIAVLKDNGTIKNFQFKDASLPAGDTLTFNAGFNVTDTENQSIECYVWNSIFGMTALADKYTITASGITQTGNN